jgi:hypothetical protein
MSAYQAGRAAFEEGVELSGNPYELMSPEWHEWQRGWTDAQEGEL